LWTLLLRVTWGSSNASSHVLSSELLFTFIELFIKLNNRTWRESISICDTRVMAEEILAVVAVTITLEEAKATGVPPENSSSRTAAGWCRRAGLNWRRLVWSSSCFSRSRLGGGRSRLGGGRSRLGSSRFHNWRCRFGAHFGCRFLSATLDNQHSCRLVPCGIGSCRSRVSEITLSVSAHAATTACTTLTLTMR